nr:hypothetical protein [Candidatus Acidoferrales bacterium]
MSDTRSPGAPLPSATSETKLQILSLLLRESRHSTIVAVKNFIKILIGRKPYFDERLLFLWQIVLHLTGLRPLKKITCRPVSSEGPGSQILAVMNAINFARCAGLTYVHTPLSEIEHADRPMQEWAAAWETLFGLGAGEAACEPGSREIVTHFPPLMEKCLGWDRRTNEIYENFNAMIPEFRRKYYLNKSPRQNCKLTIAVHVRRGWDVNIPSGNYLFGHATSILSTITLVKNILDSHAIPHTISIFSEGGPADFAELNFSGIQISKYRVGRHARGRTDDISDLSLPTGESVLDIDAISALQEMVESDILIMTKSSFSYCAGLISDGIKISNFVSERPPIDGWLVRSDDGSFDIAAFERQLSELMQINPIRK